MDKTLFARIWFGLIALQIAIVVPTRMVLSWNDINGDFEKPLARAFNVLCFFTIQSNLIVCVVSAMLFLSINRSSRGFVVAQLTGLVCIIVAGTVYYLLLAGEEELTGLAVITNFVVHTSAPIMFTIGWLLFVEHGQTTWRSVKFALVFPISWAIFAMARGALIHYYPYPFMNVGDLGYTTALLNMFVVTLFFIMLFVGAHLLDSKLLNRAD